jgi:hypothetical protein
MPPVVALPVLVTSLIVHGVGHRPAMVRAATPHCSAAEEAGEDDATFSACMKMRVSELKAELDLRKIDYANMFEKDELARCLADARAAGRADPSLLDDFNRQSAESAWTADSGQSAPDFEAAAEAVASDGGLPGGMSPDKLQQLMQDPELMAMLRNPKMQEVRDAHARRVELAATASSRIARAAEAPC